MEDLKTLTVLRLVEVAGYVHRLNPNVEKRRREALSATAGSLCGSEGEDFERAVKEAPRGFQWVKTRYREIIRKTGNQEKKGRNAGYQPPRA